MTLELVKTETSKESQMTSLLGQLLYSKPKSIAPLMESYVVLEEMITQVEQGPAEQKLIWIPFLTKLLELLAKTRSGLIEQLELQVKVAEALDALNNTDASEVEVLLASEESDNES